MTNKNSNLSETVLTQSISEAYPRTKPGVLHVAVLSDVHLGHKHNAASDIVRNLMDAFPDNAETASLDIIFIAGDFFDDLLTLDDPDVIAIDMFIVYLLRLCKRYNIMLRVLEGTASHDWKQSARFETLNEHARINAPLKYVSTLSIEYIPEFDINVLYVPDDLPGGTEKTQQTVVDMLRANGLEKVDIAIMHGQFHFQLPPHVHAPKHSEEFYLNIVKGPIWIGHDHTAKQHERIYVQGSFDRIGHGYETPKGHMRGLLQADGEWDVKFIENVNAMKFVTVNCKSLSLEDTLTKIRLAVADLPDSAYVRIRADADNPIFTNMDTLIRMRPMIVWAKDPQQQKEKEITPLTEADAVYIPIAITRENINELLMERLASSGASGRVIDKALDILEELFPWKKPITNQPTNSSVVS